MTPELFLLSIPSIIGAAVWYRLGKMNGDVKRVIQDVEHIKGRCPLCQDLKEGSRR